MRCVWFGLWPYFSAFYARDWPPHIQMRNGDRRHHTHSRTAALRDQYSHTEVNKKTTTVSQTKRSILSTLTMLFVAWNEGMATAWLQRANEIHQDCETVSSEDEVYHSRHSPLYHNICLIQSANNLQSGYSYKLCGAYGTNSLYFNHKFLGLEW